MQDNNGLASSSMKRKNCLHKISWSTKIPFVNEGSMKKSEFNTLQFGTYNSVNKTVHPSLKRLNKVTVHPTIPPQTELKLPKETCT